MTRGWIEVIVGPMFSGKTEELLRRVKRETYRKKEVKVFKPQIDNRYSESDVVSHSGATFGAESVDHAEQMLTRAGSATVIGIDEANLYEGDLVPVCEVFASCGVQVIVSGLDLDSRGKPWAPIPALLCVAERIVKLSAICMVCGEPATRTYRKVKSDSLIEVGGSKSYEARCWECHLR